MSREKLTILWINKRKKATKIIKNNGRWPKDESVNITVEENENYYRSIPKFVISCDFNPNRERYFRSEDVIIQNSELFSIKEIEVQVKSCPNGKACGVDGVYYEDIKTNWEDIGDIIKDIFNLILINLKVPESWKESVVQRIPKKNFDRTDMSTLRDISLMPTIYKIFSKCICKIIKPFIIEKVAFWQRAYITNRDRQDLIFCLKTAIDDFKHKSTKFHTVFIDFKDAFGNVDHTFMFETLRLYDIPKMFCVLIENLYKYSSFRIICNQELSEKFYICRGTKTGDPFSSFAFILVIDRVFRPMFNSALIDLNIRNEHKIKPLPIKAFADDIAMCAYEQAAIKNMIRVGEPLMKEAGLEVKGSKCAVLYERRSGNNWYKGRKDQAPSIVNQNQELTVYSRCNPYVYLGKSLTVNGEDPVQVLKFIVKFKSNVDKICACNLPITLKCSAINNLALAQILHHFYNTRLEEQEIEDLDKYVTTKIRQLLGIYSSTTDLIIYLPRKNGRYWY